MTVFCCRNGLAIGLLAAQLWGCGMKGPPLAPFVRVPAPLTDLVVQRLGDEVSIGFTLPTANEDRSEPASLVRVDVYAMTTQPRLPPDRALELEEFQEAATLVASVEVAPPPPPPEPESDAAAPAETPPAEPPSETPPSEAPPADAAVLQGSPVALAEGLTAETEVPVDPWEEERLLRAEAEAEAEARDDEDIPEEPERPVMVPLMTPPLPGPLQREYVVVHVSTAGEESEAGERIAVPLGIRAPEPPPAPEVVYTETTVDVTWDLPPGVRETVQAPVTDEPAEPVEETVEGGVSDEPAGAPEDTAEAAGTDEPAEAAGTDEPTEEAAAPPPADVPASDEAPVSDEAPNPDEATPLAGADTSVEPGTTDAGDEADAPVEDEAVVPLTRLESRPIVEWPPASTYELFEVPAPDAGSPAVPERLSQTPLDTPAYADQRVEYGVERCYAVRTLDVVAGFEVGSPMSPVTCVTFVDTFPPATPQALTAVGSDGEVSLLWRPNEDADLAGYVVLRGSPGDETLHPLTDAPLTGNTYRDATAEPGVRHVYAVRAVDSAATPNLSELSDRAEAAAR